MILKKYNLIIASIFEFTFLNVFAFIHLKSQTTTGAEKTKKQIKSRSLRAGLQVYLFLFFFFFD
jgi:hypothetical protein